MWIIKSALVITKDSTVGNTDQSYITAEKKASVCVENMSEMSSVSRHKLTSKQTTSSTLHYSM